MHDAFLQRLRRGVVVLDGGLATELERSGHDLDHPLWSARCLMEDPEAIVAVHRAFLRAGAEVITTATYQASYPGLLRQGLDEKHADALFDRGTALAREAIEHEGVKAIVAASVGSYGAFLADGSEYRGGYGLSVEDLVAFHRRRIERLAHRADVLACETVPCRVEAEALAICLREVDVPAWVSFVGRDGRHLGSGEALVDAIEVFHDVPQIAALGINCTAPRYVESLVRVAVEATDAPIVVYPNSGEGYDGAWTGEALDPKAFGAMATRWVAAGARLVGGCCRTGPEHISALAHRFLHAATTTPHH